LPDGDRFEQGNSFITEKGVATLWMVFLLIGVNRRGCVNDGMPYFFL
jgi:hypothetical protein